MSNQNRNRVFVSYSHKDKDWLNKFRDVLAPEIRNGRVDYWDDKELQPGDPWYDRIIESISVSRVAVLFVTPNFLSSRFIMEDELPRIIKASGDGLTIIWIPIFGTFYGIDVSPEVKNLNCLQAACDAGKPLAELDDTSQTATLLELCRHLQRLLNPGRVPWNLPFNSLAGLFKGRNETLDKLNLNLKQHGASAIVQPQVIQGLGGIGKTRLVIEYAWQHQNDFTAFLFVSANKPEDLDRNLAVLCAPDWGLDLAEQKSPNQQEQRDAVIRWLQQNKGWLLILDNVDTDEGVISAKALISKLRGGHVLITSRVTSWGRGIHTIALDVLSIDDAVGLLLDSTKTWRSLRPEDSVQARILAEKLGCLPLALTHATAYMEHLYLGFNDYLNDFESHFERLLAYHDHLAIEYETELEKERKGPASQEEKIVRKQLLKTVATTYFLSFDRLVPEAKAILQSAALLSPDPIPIAIYEQCPNEVSAIIDLWCEETSEAKTDIIVAEALANLSKYSLISRSDGFFSVHRMEQRILKSRVKKEFLPKWHENTQKLIYKYAPDETAESPRTWAIWDILRPHVEFLVESFIGDDQLPVHMKLMSSLGTLLFGKGLYNLSLRVDEDSLKVVKRMDDSEGKVMADRLLNYGESLRELDRPEEALAAFSQSLKIREENDGTDSLRVAVVLNYVGLAFKNLQKTEDAERCYRQAISICESHLNDSDFDIEDLQKPLVNLATIVEEKGDLIEAEKLLLRAVEISSNVDETKIKPQTQIICRGHLAFLLNKKKDFVKAEQFFKDAVDRVKVFPEDHPLLENVLNAYAVFLHNLRRLAEAKKFYLEVNRIIENKYEKEKPELATFFNNFALLERDLGNLEDAELLFHRALKIRGKLLPSGNIDTLDTYRDLADLLEKMGRKGEAKELRLRSLEHEPSELTPLDLRKNALEYFNLGDYENAEKLLNRVLAEKFEIPGTHCHLTRICILTNRIIEAHEHIEQAWQHRSEAPIYVAARILWFKIASAFMEGSYVEYFVGQLKKVLQNENAFMEWTMQPVLDHIKPQITEHQHALLCALVDAFSFKEKVDILNNFEEWRDAKPEELD
jgi:tetratricopeptide (TPR) repeat protein